MSKIQLEDAQQENADRELAKKLGIQYEELINLQYEIHENQSDDGLVYGYYVEFDPAYGKEILSKIKNLDSNYVFNL